MAEDLDIKPGDRLLHRGEEYRVLSVEPGRMDPIVTSDTADIEAINERDDVDFFGFEDVDAVWTDGWWVTTPAYKAVLEESRRYARVAVKSAEGQPGS